MFLKICRSHVQRKEPGECGEETKQKTRAMVLLWMEFSRSEREEKGEPREEKEEKTRGQIDGDCADLKLESDGKKEKESRKQKITINSRWRSIEVFTESGGQPGG